MNKIINIGEGSILDPEKNELTLSNGQVIKVQDASEEAIKGAEEYCRVLEGKNLAKAKK